MTIENLTTANFPGMQKNYNGLLCRRDLKVGAERKRKNAGIGELLGLRLYRVVGLLLS